MAPSPPGTALPARSAEASPLEAGDEAEQQARRIIADSRAAYAACDTYEDDGKYDIVFRGDAGFSHETEFRTVVAGPSAIRFAYRDLPSEFQVARLTQLVVSDAGVREYMPWGAEPATVDSLSQAVGALRGVSHGLSGAVLPLLPIGLDTSGALTMHDAHVVGTEVIDGTMCDVIDTMRRYGPLALPEHVRVWIAQSDSLIRRLSTDEVESEEDRRKLNAMNRPMPELVVAGLREAGVSDADLETIRAHFEQPRPPMSTFETITFHPRCNEPVAPSSLQATDGSL